MTSTINHSFASATHRSIAQQLSKVPLLEGVERDVLESLAVHVHMRRVDKGKTVLHKGSSGDQLFFLFQGRLQAVNLTEDGHEIGLNFLETGSYFGELSVIDGLPRSASVVACEDSLVAALPRAIALTLIYNTPLVVERVLKRMAHSIRTASNYRAIIGIPQAPQRVFALLQQLAHSTPAGLVVIEKMPTQQEIAIMVNTSRESVSRAMNSLLELGIVEKDLKRLIVRRPDALRRAVSRGSEQE